MRDRTAKILGFLFALLTLLAAYLLAHHPLGEDAMRAPLLTNFLPASSSVLTRLSAAPGFLLPLQKKLFGPLTTPTPPLSRSSPYSTTTAVARTMGYDSITLKDAVKHRRTVYKLEKKSPISDDRIKEIVTQAIHDVPSSFNSQSTRLVVLVKEQHDKFWQIVADVLKAQLPEDQWEKSKPRIDMFEAAYGTVGDIHIRSAMHTWC
jgi:hypothetical protein